MVDSCAICGSSACADRGPILHYRPERVAGVAIELSDLTFRLKSCSSCGFIFKCPAIPEQRLLNCYARAGAGNWELNPDPLQRRFDTIADVLRRHSPGRRILDIGCFNGAFLEWLGPEWDRYGIEPSEAAAAVAGERGVKILGPLIHEMIPPTAPLDAVLAIDVMEHIPEPLGFFQRVRQLLAPAGVFIILTGDTQALTWRSEGSLYWYCSLPEHVSFYNATALGHIGRRAGLDLIEHRRLSHQRATLSRKVQELVKNVAFLSGSRMRWLGVKPLRDRMNRCAPMWLTARDHILAVLRAR